MRGCRKNAVGWNVSFFDTRCIWFHPCNKPQGLPAVGPLSPYMSYRHLTPRGRWLLGNLLSYFLRDRMSLFSLFLSLFLRRQRALFLTSLSFHPLSLSKNESRQFYFANFLLLAPTRIASSRYHTVRDTPIPLSLLFFLLSGERCYLLVFRDLYIYIRGFLTKKNFYNFAENGL